MNGIPPGYGIGFRNFMHYCLFCVSLQSICMIILSYHLHNIIILLVLYSHSKLYCVYICVWYSCLPVGGDL